MTLPEGRCGSCKHWTEYDGFNNPIPLRLVVPYTDEAEEAQEAEQVRVNRLYRECKAVEENPEIYFTPGQDIGPLPLAMARDGSAYMANVFTQAEFGCVLWAAPDG